MKRKYLIIVAFSLIIVTSLTYGNEKIEETKLKFDVLDTKLKLENNNTQVYLSVKNEVNKKVILNNFIITLYNSNKNMIVSSAASICLYGDSSCVLQPFETREFTLTVGVDATDTKYIEYKLD